MAERSRADSRFVVFIEGYGENGFRGGPLNSICEVVSGTGSHRLACTDCRFEPYRTK